MAATDEALSNALARAVKDLGGHVLLYALAGSKMVAAARQLGLGVVQEVFADRAYEDNGTLRPRSLAGAMIEDEAVAVARVIEMVQRGQVRVCDPVPAGNSRYGEDYYGDGRVSGYDVTYEYGNRTYHTRTDHHPGDRIRIRVDVRPE